MRIVHLGVPGIPSGPVSFAICPPEGGDHPKKAINLTIGMRHPDPEKADEPIREGAAPPVIDFGAWYAGLSTAEKARVGDMKKAAETLRKSKQFQYAVDEKLISCTGAA